MFKYAIGDKVKLEGRYHIVLGRWSSGVGPWYSVRQVKGKGLTGFLRGVPEHRLRE